MLSDMINPNLYFSKKSNNLNSDIFVKQVIALLVLNFIYLISKEIFSVFIINVIAVVLLAKLNEIISIKKYNMDFPCLKIVVVNKNQSETCSSSPSVNVSFGPTEDSSNYEIKIEQDDNVLLKDSCISNSGIHVNEITDSHIRDNFNSNPQVSAKNMVDICTQTPSTINSTFLSVATNDKTNMKCKYSDEQISVNSNNKCMPTAFSKTDNHVDTSKSCHINRINSQNDTEPQPTHESVSKSTFPLIRSNLNDILSVLPKFHGSSKRFLKFKHRFQTIIEQFHVNFEQKGLLLFLSLDEKVSESLGIICVDKVIDYNELWKQLESEYFGPQHGPLYNGAMLNTLSNWSVCDNFDKLQHLYKFILCNHRSLEIQGLAKNDYVTAIAVLLKLRGDLALEVSHAILESQGEPVLSKILKIIKDELNTVELNELVYGTHDDLKNTENISNKNVCIFCKCDHESKYCRKYQNPYDFYLYLKQKNACFNCTGLDHKVFACPKSKICSLCKDTRKHSTVLCKHNYLS